MLKAVTWIESSLRTQQSSGSISVLVRREDEISDFTFNHIKNPSFDKERRI
jgi:hypothetical protein